MKFANKFAADLHSKRCQFFWLPLYNKKVNSFIFKLTLTYSSNLAALIPQQISLRELKHNLQVLSHFAIED